MTKQLQYLLWLAVTLVCAIIISCTNEFISSQLDSYVVSIADNLDRVDEFAVELGLRDSVSGFYLAGFDKVEELRNSSDTGAFNMLKRTRQIKLRWKLVDGAEKYEIRVLKEPITNSNWFTAEKLNNVKTVIDDDYVRAIVELNPSAKIYSGRCVGCGECLNKCIVDAITISNGKALIDSEKCIECGKCYRYCSNNAIGGSFLGVEYYIAIRAINNEGEYSAKINCLTDKYLSRHVTLTIVPDSLKTVLESGIDSNSGKSLPAYGGCIGNCSFDACFANIQKTKVCKTMKINVEPDTEYGVAPNTVCPVGAIFELAAEDTIHHVNRPDAIMIDSEKCINCGRCVVQCHKEGYGSITSEVIKVN